MTPLSLEAVAQAPEWPAHVDCKVECWFSPTLRTLAAENATLRAENEELDFLRHEGGPDSVAAMEIELATLRAERDAWTKIDVARDVDFATLRASEAAALERITELEALLAASTHSPRLPE